MTVRLKRVYDQPSKEDGTRVLVDRLWPRGLTKEQAAIGEWLKDIAPSNELRKWYHAHPQQWSKFRKQYLQELKAETAHEGLEKLYKLMANPKGVTLLFASKDIERNNALVLKELIEGKPKPPTGTGRAGAAAGRRRVAIRR